MRIDDLSGKKIAIWGLGKEGWASYRIIRKYLPNLKLTILNDQPLSQQDQNLISRDCFAEVLTGGDISEHLLDFELVIKSPGISKYRPEVTKATLAGVEFSSATRLWFSEHHQDQIIAVTGSKGKSTTASLIHFLLQNLGYRVILGGNIGLPIIDMLRLEPKPDYWVLELSSYQTSDLEYSPSLGLLLNLYPEHLDWHKDVETYFKDKINLFKWRTDGINVINYLDKNISNLDFNWYNPVYFNHPDQIHAEDNTIFIGKKPLLNSKALKLQGIHNLSNICAALTALSRLGIDPEKCLEPLSKFDNLPHRLQVLGEQDGVLFVDDSVSTIPQSTMAAVEVYADRAVTILLGGFDRGLEWQELANFLVQKPVYAIITMPDSGNRISDAVQQALNNSILKPGIAKENSTPRLYQAEDLEQAVNIAKKITPRGGVILLSPASPSYGKFKNYEERGELFAKIAGFFK